MAAEPWNRVNIPFPSAVSSVRINFTATTGVRVKTVLVENEKVLKLIRCEILQTEIRLLYDLLYVLNNSSRGNKTFKGLQQVEQCINRLKNMKLDVALEELSDLCPSRIQRDLCIKAGEGDVPSQPMLEWLCLKVLGAAELMSCTLSRCSRAFVLSKQHMKWEEFIILNVVITSMLSRLWVVFRGILASLSTLYLKIVELRSEVADARPMPFLNSFSLPADMAEFLGPAGSILTKHGLHNKNPPERQQTRRKPSVQLKNRGQTWNVKEDLGVSVNRGLIKDSDMKPFLNIFRKFTEGKSLPRKAKKKEMLKKQMREASSFADMGIHLEKTILWCKSQKMGKEKRLLTFLRLKCQKMKCLEAAGYSVQRKLQTFRREACCALSPQRSAPRTCRSLASTKRNAHLRSRFHTLRSQLKSSAVRGCIRKRPLERRRRKSELSASGLSKDDQRSTTTNEVIPQTSDCDNCDDIDDIFASVGL